MHSLRFVLVLGLLATACSSSGQATPASVRAPTTTVSSEATSDAGSSTEENVTSATSETAPAASDAPSLVDTTIEETIALVATPDVIDAAATRSCDRYGYVCSLHLASEEQIEAGQSALTTIRGAMSATDDAREQMRLAAAAAARIEGIGHLEVDSDHATQIAFTIDNGPRLIVLTDAALLNADADVPDLVRPVEASQIIAGSATTGQGGDETNAQDDEPTGLTRSSSSSGPTGLRGAIQLPRRYEPTGGTLTSRSALVLSPFGWESANDIAAIFEAEDEYGQVDLLVGPEVTPDVLLTLPAYDAVHILSHGGGSCPSWTEDRSECTSTIVGGEFDSGIYQQILADFAKAEEAAGASVDELADVAFWMCESGGVDRYCFNSSGFPTNPDGITFFAVCGSDFGFGGSNGGGGASVTWTGTTQRLVAERTGAEFWRLMVGEGVEFELASSLLTEGGYDDHKLTWWASAGAVNMFTNAAFSGRNLRARDVVDATFGGDAMAGQAAKISGTPDDGNDETFPTDGETLSIVLEGVQTGSEAGVTIEVRGDGTVWKSDIDVARDGTIIKQGDGFATWRIDVPDDAIIIPALSLKDLAPSRAPFQIEIRAFESAGEFTAVRGSLRFGADLVANGSIPIFDQLAAGLPAGGEVIGNDLEVAFFSGGGDLTGRLKVELRGQGISIGEWTIDIDGTFDPATGSVVGDVVATAQSTLPGFTNFGDFGNGQATGTVDFGAGTVSLAIAAGDAGQDYVGIISG